MYKPVSSFVKFYKVWDLPQGGTNKFLLIWNMLVSTFSLLIIFFWWVRTGKIFRFSLTFKKLVYAQKTQDGFLFKNPNIVCVFRTTEFDRWFAFLKTKITLLNILYVCICVYICMYVCVCANLGTQEGEITNLQMWVYFLTCVWHFSFYSFLN